MPPEAHRNLEDKNRAFFKVRRPDALSLIESQGPAVSKPVFENGRAVNIDLGKVTLYPAPAPAWTSRQIEDYFKAPDRVPFPDPADDGLCAAGTMMRDAVEGFLKDTMSGPLRRNPVADVGYAFIFGIGLGYHIAPLVDRGVARNLILIEPIPEFLAHSFSALDWRDLFEKADAKGIRIHFKIGQEPDRTLLEIEGLIIHEKGSLFLDGAYAYVHYPSWPLDQGRRLLNQKIMNFLVRPGNFDTEIPMMVNAIGNLRLRPFYLLDEKSPAGSDLPVFIVGSGPSLDKDLGAIEKWRDRVLLISSGVSSLGVLLRHGIRPDLHLENENSKPLVHNLARLNETAGLEGIRLAAAVSVDPEVGGMFHKRWFYSRALLSPNDILLGDDAPLLYAGPLTANAALAVAAAVGFRTVYLFGVDCGSREGGKHHSTDAVYYDPGYDNFIEGESHDTMDDELERSVPGNFGGEVITSAYYDLSRRTMTELRRRYGVSLYNCGDGARIDGATPKASASIDLSGAPTGRQAAELGRIENGLAYHEAGSFPYLRELRGHRDAFSKFSEALIPMIDAARREDGGFWEFSRRLNAFKADHGEEFGGVFKLIGGSLESMLRLGAYSGDRIESPKERDAFLKAFLDRFGEGAQRVAGEAMALLERLEKG